MKSQNFYSIIEFWTNILDFLYDGFNFLYNIYFNKINNILYYY